MKIARSVVALVAAGCGSIGEWQPITVDAGLVYLESELDDGSPVRCLVDTGASLTILHTDRTVNDPSLVLVGDRDLALYAVAALEADPFLESLGVDCLLGWSALEEVAFTIDYANARMRLTDREEKDRRLDLDLELGEPLVVPLAFSRPVPTIEAVFQDAPSLAVVDTGAQVALLDPALFAELADPPETESALVNTPDGILSAEFGVLSAVTLGERTHDEVDFVSYDSVQLDAAAESLGDDLRGLVGASTLLRYVVTFDDPRGELILHPYPDSVQEELLTELRDSLRSGGSSDPRARVRAP